MSKTLFHFSVGDISSFAQSLRGQLNGLEHFPSHVEMLNLLCKAGGYRNFQHFRTQYDAQHTQDVPRQQPAEVDSNLIKKLRRHFDAEGRLIRWPKKFTLRMICLWVMWSRIPAKKTLTERDINTLLEQQHLFGDYALLRRELFDRGLVDRTDDGRQYKRCERQPPAEAVELFKHLSN